ncbi:MAG: SCP2 sterol-binding domain-containing protein [Deltaproteobacteria bacterium]|nr:SCP2 sterol-binding domain-containing protein [Deltaproteobacteria bacterium]
MSEKFTDCKPIFERIQKGLAANADAAKANVGGVFKFVVTGDKGGTWLVNCKDNVGVTAADGDADCTITVDDETFLAINNREMDGQMAFMSGKLMVSGDMSFAFKLGQVLGGGQQ